MAKIVVGHKKEQDLNEVKNMTLEMFDQVIKMLDLSINLLESPENENAIRIIEEDVITDDIQNDIIVEINNVIIIHQPKAIDLRLVLGTYQLIADLERIGDYCKTFAKTLIKTDLDERKQQQIVEIILKELSVRMKETRVAYDKTDHNLAKIIAKRDTEIDDGVKNLRDDIIKKLKESRDEKEIKALTRILSLATIFDRSGDHIVNICEQISYIKKGQIYHYS